MKVLSYNGYQGSVEYDDGELFIKLLHINDSVSTTCKSADEVEAEFHGLVDDYLETCAELGQEPDKPFKGSFNIRMSPELHREIVMKATAQGVSLNSWAVDAMQQKMDRETFEQNRMEKQTSSNTPSDVDVTSSDSKAA